jgi:transposase-like protein
MDKKSKMLQLVKGWKNSGLSRVAFAQQHGITIHSFEYWRRKLKKEEDKLPVGNQSGIKHICPPSFIEIGNNSAHNSANRQAQVELELPGGLRIKIY